MLRINHTRETQHQQYEKEYKRVYKMVERAEKKGYKVNTFLLPQYSAHPTKYDISKLRSYDMSDIYLKSTKELYTGETLRGDISHKVELRIKREERVAQKREREYHDYKQREYESRQLEEWYEEQRDKREHQRHQDEDFIEQHEDTYYAEEYERKYSPKAEDYIGNEYTPPEPSTINTENGYTIDTSTGEILSKPTEDGYIVDVTTGEILSTPPTAELPINIITTEDGYTIDASTGEIISKPAPEKPLRDREKYNILHGKTREGKPLPTRPALEPLPTYPQFTDTVINNFRGYIDGFPKNISDKINHWLDGLMTTAGADKVAIMLEANSLKLGDYLSKAGYDSDGAVLEYCTDMLNYLPEMSEDEQQDIMDEFEGEDTDWEDGEW